MTDATDATVVAVTREVAASADRVWEVLAAFGDVAAFNPVIATSRSIGAGPDRGLGAQRHCEMHAPGAWVEETVTAWDEAARSMVARIERGTGKPPLGEVDLAFAVVPAEDTSSSIVTMRIDVRPRNLLQRGAVPAARPMLQRMAETVLAGLAVRATTGRRVETRADLD